MSLIDFKQIVMNDLISQHGWKYGMHKGDSLFKENKQINFTANQFSLFLDGKHIYAGHYQEDNALMKYFMHN